MLIIPKLTYTRESDSFKLSIPDLKISYGKLILIKGANGSGKTTFGKILSGEIKTNYNNTFNSLYLDQTTDNNVFSDLKISEHLKLCKDKEKIKQIRTFFPVINQLWNKYPDQLSGGEKQLIGFCSIIISNSQVYIFDELLNHLDHSIQTKVLEFIKLFLVNKSNNIVFIIAHKYEQLENYFDDTIHISNNQIYFN